MNLIPFGESHGAAVGGVILDCPPQFAISFAEIDQALARRSGPRNEPDRVEWLSGLMDGVTLGTPLAFMVRNCDARSQDYEALRTLYRPGHADYTYQQRFGIRDWRGGGHASARVTAAHVVAGSIAAQMLAQKGIAIHAEVEQEGPRKEGDTHGGTIRCQIDGVPAGAGTPPLHKLNADLSAAMFAIPSAIGFEMGDGFATAQMSGSQYIDRWNSNLTTQTNHCGGIQGGISNGMPITFSVAFHPIVTLPQGMPCADAQGNLADTLPGGRHDSCQLQRATVIVEAQAALTLSQHIEL